MDTTNNETRNAAAYLGSLGGNKTKQKYGREHYVNMRKLSAGRTKNIDNTNRETLISE